MPEKECKYQEEVYKVQTFRTTQGSCIVKNLISNIGHNSNEKSWRNGDSKEN